MSIERKTQVINATGSAELARGNFFLLLAASAPVNVRADRDGTSEGFDGIIGGFIIERVRPWDQMIVFGSVGDSIEYVVGTENVSQDLTDIRLGVSAIAGTVSVIERPSDTINDNAPVVASNPSAPAADESVLIAANPNRRRLRVTADSLNPGPCYVLSVTGGNPIDELQAGTSKEFDTLQGLFVTNANGADCTFYLNEEE